MSVSTVQLFVYVCMFTVLNAAYFYRSTLFTVFWKLKRSRNLPATHCMFHFCVIDIKIWCVCGAGHFWLEGGIHWKMHAINEQATPRTHLDTLTHNPPIPHPHQINITLPLLPAHSVTLFHIFSFTILHIYPLHIKMLLTTHMNTKIIFNLKTVNTREALVFFKGCTDTSFNSFLSTKDTCWVHYSP